jgi:YtcA-like protein
MTMSAHRGRLGLLLTCLTSAGCERAPSFDILGSYFPAWLVCLTTALLLTVLTRLLLLRLKIELALPIVVYPSLLAGLAFAQWLLFLR